MSVYDQLVDALDCLPNGFPRTPSSVEIAPPVDFATWEQERRINRGF